MANRHPVRREPSPRFPFDVLLHKSGATTVQEFIDLASIQPLGLTWNAVAHFQSEGLSAKRADLLACAIGSHPACCWPDWYERTAKPGDLLVTA